jgi:hypothetical protein
MGKARNTHGEKKNAYRIWWESRKERDHQEHLDIDGRVISKWIFDKYMKFWEELISYSLIQHVRHRRRLQQFSCCVWYHCRGDVFIEPFPSNVEGCT